MSVKDKDKFRLLILQIRYLRAQLSINEQVFEEAQAEFAKAYHEVCKTVPEHEREVLMGALMEETKANQEEKEKKQKQGQPEEDNSQPEEPSEVPDEITPTKNQKPEDPNVKKIYRAIARKSHPDKLTNASKEEIKEKEDLFKEAQTAIQQKDFLTLYDIAKRLDVDLPDPEEGQIKLLTNDVNQVKKDLNLIKETTAWQWHHAECEDRKEIILIRYMQYIYQRFK